MKFGYNKVRPNFCYNYSVAELNEKVVACNLRSLPVVIDEDHLFKSSLLAVTWK